MHARSVRGAVLVLELALQRCTHNEDGQTDSALTFAATFVEFLAVWSLRINLGEIELLRSCLCSPADNSEAALPAIYGLQASEPSLMSAAYWVNRRLTRMI